MASGYDGSIRIDTKIDEGGFNRSVRNLGGKVKDLGLQMASTVGRMLTGFAKVAGIVSLIAFAVTRLIRSIVTSVNQFMRIGQRTQALKADFEALRASVRNAFLPLLHVALPLLQRVAQWLTNIFNIIGMVIGALTGQTQVMRATASAAGDAAGGAGKLAKNTKEAEKAAKGALAAFDEINVLEIDEPISTDDIEDSVGGSGDGLGGFEMVPISQWILDLIQGIKDFLEPLKEPILALWEALKGLWEAAKAAFQPWFEWLKEQNILEILRDLAINGIKWLTERIKDLTEWINNNQAAFRVLAVVIGIIAVALLLILSPALAVKAVILGVIAVILILIAYWPEIAEEARGAWENIKNTWNTVANWFLTRVWQPLTNWAANTLNSIWRIFENVAQWIKSTWQGIPGWFMSTVWQPLLTFTSNVLNNIGQFFANLWANVINWSTNAVNTVIDLIGRMRTGISTAVDWIKTKWETAWTGIVSFIRTILNNILSGVFTLINGFISGINLLIRGANLVPGVNIPELQPVSVPQLAKGAVIPPNSQFLAVLGDQRAGRNIETPEGLMRQIIREELEGMDMGNGEVTINFAGSLGALVRELKPYIEKEDRRVGISLVRGVS